MPSIRRIFSSRIGFGSIFALGSVAVIYLISPFWTLWSIERAMKVNNSKKVVSYLDWTSVSHSIKKQVTPPEDGLGEDLPGFGRSFLGSVIVNKMNNDTPENFLKSIHGFILPVQNNSPSSTMFWPFSGHLHAHFTSPNTFSTELEEPGKTPLIIHMEFVKWGWKITRFDLPTPLNNSTPRP
ncbi:DUF2939 domain-containing protein [Swingsia samuiensis]|uniref:DUF2939 domain-containing protein n=1 Tax=Swingsia samuiensis TaxID=1293412 RepID=A0A4Y6UL45_9PROT|nr:DUF2939 domain-containing protein [Swingsia samuiensis]QDH17794.1 DUF2939 domain-containing protein [Swingsia samuiensis]